MSKKNRNRKARRQHAMDLMVVSQCPECEKFIILRGRADQVDAHIDKGRAIAHAFRLAEGHLTRDVSCPEVVIVAESGEGVRPWLLICDAELP